MTAKQFKHPLYSDKQLIYSALQLEILQALKSYWLIDWPTLIIATISTAKPNFIYNKYFQLDKPILKSILIQNCYPYQQLNYQLKFKSFMLLQRNLFSIYRIVIKTPKLILVLALAFAIFVAFTQIVYMSKTNRSIDLSGVLLNYLLTKNQGRKTISKQILQNNSLIQDINHNKSNSNNSSNSSTVAQSDDYSFLDDSTVLHFRFASDRTKTIHVNYQYSYDYSNPPVIVMVKNQHLLSLQKTEQSYLKKHGITYDLILIPPLQIEEPAFAYYFLKDMQEHQIMAHSLRESFVALDIKFNLYLIANNITQIVMKTNQLHLAFYLQSRSYPLSINFFQFLSMKFTPAFLLKIVYSFIVLVVTITANIFMGLLVRYFIIALFTVYLFIYSCCNNEGQGWVNQYMALVCKKYAQNKMLGFKIGLFYILASIMMPLLLAFGSYCVLLKLILPSVPLFLEKDAMFYTKTMFFIQIFHFIFSRSRTTIIFFPIFSIISNFTTLTIACLKYQPIAIMMLNLNLTIQMIGFIIFILIQKLITQENQKGLQGPYCPSFSKPRMMFFVGYDISWQKSLPPIWTYFTQWFDYSLLGESQKCLIEKDYQLLYGRMLGLNDRQEIPECQVQLREQQMGLEEQASNQLNLIQQQ